MTQSPKTTFLPNNPAFKSCATTRILVQPEAATIAKSQDELKIPPLLFGSLKAMFVTRYLIAVCFFVGAISAESSESDNDWPRWRGPQDSGSIEFGSYPVQLDAAHVLWQAPLPGKGCSTPIVWQQTIYATAVDGNDALLAFDWSGK